MVGGIQPIGLFICLVFPNQLLDFSSESGWCLLLSLLYVMYYLCEKAGFG